MVKGRRDMKAGNGERRKKKKMKNRKRKINKEWKANEKARRRTIDEGGGDTEREVSARLNKEEKQGNGEGKTDER